MWYHFLVLLTNYKCTISYETGIRQWTFFALLILMAWWCFGTRASIATVLSMSWCTSNCLWAMYWYIIRQSQVPLQIFKLELQKGLYRIAGPFNRITGPFDRIAGPFGGIAGPFGRLAGPFGRIAGPFGRTAGLFGRIAGFVAAFFYF